MTRTMPPPRAWALRRKARSESCASLLGQTMQIDAGGDLAMAAGKALTQAAAKRRQRRGFRDRQEWTRLIRGAGGPGGRSRPLLRFR